MHVAVVVVNSFVKRSFCMRVSSLHYFYVILYICMYVDTWPLSLDFFKFLDLFLMRVHTYIPCAIGMFVPMLITHLWVVQDGQSKKYFSPILDLLSELPVR
jgi:hypothetical protein